MNAALAVRVSGSSRSRTFGIIAAYTLVFFGVLPWALWRLGVGLDQRFAFPTPGPFLRSFGGLLFGAGATLMTGAMLTLVGRGRGLPISHLPPLVLVMRGFYAHVRHPIYVGFSLTFGGAALAAGSFGAGAIAPAILTAGWLIYALGFEEPRLRERFGASYAAYAQRSPLFPGDRWVRRFALHVWLRVRPAAERLANHTVLFRTGSAVWVTYGLWVALGGVAGAVAAAPWLGGLGLSAADIAIYELGLAASMLLGGRLVWLGYEWQLLRSDPSAMARRVGFVSFGGYAGFVLYGLAFAHSTGCEAAELFDRTLPPAFLISAFGRLGCLSYGCCYGRRCAHGLTYSAPAAKVIREQGDAGRSPRVPVPLLSVLLALGVSGTGFATLVARSAAGTATGLSLLVYGILRFGLELLRDERRFTSFALTRGQLLAMPIALSGFAGLVREPKRALAAGFDGSVLLPLLPVFAAVGLAAFVVCGFHRREVGRW